MKAVGVLLGLWCEEGGSGSVIAAAIATDEPPLGMLLQPQRKAQLRAVGQQINDAMRFQIQEDGAIRSATPERKVVYTQHRHRCRDWLWGHAEQAQDGLIRDMHAQRRCDGFSAAAADSQSQRRTLLDETDGFAGPRTKIIRKALRKYLPGTSAVP